MSSNDDTHKVPDPDLITYRVLDMNDVREATKLQIESSFQEVLTIGFGIADVPGGTDHEGFEVLLGSIIADGLSIGAFDSDTGKMVGVCFNKIHKKQSKKDEPAPLEENVEENMKHPATLDLMRFIFKIESSVDLFTKYNTPTAVEIFYIGVDSHYRRYGIAKALMDKSLLQARDLAKKNGHEEPQVAYAVYTSVYSQALAEKFKFEWLHEVPYDTYVCYDGKLMSERIGSLHKAAKLGARKI